MNKKRLLELEELTRKAQKINEVALTSAKAKSETKSDEVSTNHLNIAKFQLDKGFERFQERTGVDAQKLHPFNELCVCIKSKEKFLREVSQTVILFNKCINLSKVEDGLFEVEIAAMLDTLMMLFLKDHAFSPLQSSSVSRSDSLETSSVSSSSTDAAFIPFLSQGSLSASVARKSDGISKTPRSSVMNPALSETDSDSQDSMSSFNSFSVSVSDLCSEGPSGQSGRSSPEGRGNNIHDFDDDLLDLLEDFLSDKSIDW